MKAISKKWLPPVAGIAVLATAAVIWLNLPKREDLLAAHAGGCFLDADFSCLMSMASPSEQKAYDMSPQELAMLSAFARQNGVGRLRKVSTGTLNFFPPEAKGTYSVEVETPASKPLVLTFQVTRQKAGSFYSFNDAMTQLTYILIHQDAELRVEGSQEFAALRSYLRANAGQFERFGVSGQYSKKRNVIVPWAQVSERYDKIEQQIAEGRQEQP